MRNFLMITVIMALIFYLTGCVMWASFNLAEWNPDGRSFLGASYLLVICGVGMIMGMINIPSPDK